MQNSVHNQMHNNDPNVCGIHIALHMHCLIKTWSNFQRMRPELTLYSFFLLLGPYYVKKSRNPKTGDLIGQAFCLQMEANLKEVGKRLNVCFTQRINCTNDQHNISNDLF